MLRASALCACALLASLGRSQGGEVTYAVVEVKNPEYRPNSLFTTEDIASANFKELRTRHKLDEVVKGETDEFRRILLLRHWLNKYIVVDQSKPAVGTDALKILEEGPKGGRYSCGHFDKAQDAVLNAMGYVSRIVFAGAGEEGGGLSGSHGVSEVWSNTYCKWVLTDAELDSHFEKDGAPLSGLEIRDEVLRDKAASVVRVQGPERKALARWNRDDTWGETPRTYTWVSWMPEGRRVCLLPGKAEGMGHEPCVVFEDDYFKTHTWYRDGKKNWLYNSNGFKRIQDRKLIEWTPNVLDVKVRINGAAAEVRIASCTPNLKEYQMKKTGGGWEAVKESFTLNLSKPREEWLLRAVNIADVTGPEHRLVIERK
jgi:hypothetical protein